MINSISDLNGGGFHKTYNFKIALGAGGDTWLGQSMTAMEATLRYTSEVATKVGVALSAVYGGLSTDGGPGGFGDIYPLKGGLVGMAMGAIAEIQVPIEHVARVANPASCRDYIATLADRVTLPADEVTMDSHELGPYTFRTPKASPSGDIQVVYIDDDKSTVELFHQVWQSMALKAMVAFKGNSFNNIQNISLAFGYVELKEDQSENEDTARLYPRVFPVKIESSGGEASGTDFKKVTVTYSRLVTEIGLSVLVPYLPSLDFLNPVLNKVKGWFKK